MERVGRSDSSSYSTKGRKQPHAGKASSGQPFSRVMEDTSRVTPSQGASHTGGETPEDRRNLEELLDDIHELGEQVKKEPGRRVVLSYKQAVQRLIRIVLDEGIEVEQQTSSPNILRQKRFTLVRVIDRKLDRLVSEVLMGQREALNMLARIDEINGLLVDLTS